MSDKVNTFEVNFGDVCRYFEKMAETDGKSTTQRHYKQSTWPRMKKKDSYGEKWYGGSIKGTLDWIKKGYNLPGLSAILNMERGELEIPRRRLKFGEDGELQLDLAWSGHDQPWIEWERRTSKRGIRIVAEVSMSCATSSDTIKDYLEWLVKMVIAFEERGETVELAISQPCTNLFESDYTTKKYQTIVNLKQADEVLDVKAWTAFFAPTGFRHLGFCALYMHAESQKQQADDSLGYPVGTKWSVDFDEATATLNIRTPSTPSGFDGEAMTTQLQAALKGEVK